MSLLSCVVTVKYHYEAYGTMCSLVAGMQGHAACVRALVPRLSTRRLVADVTCPLLSAQLTARGTTTQTDKLWINFHKLCFN